MKRKKLGLTSLLVTAALYCTTSCDTREDWFKEEGEGATFVVVSGNRIDTIDCLSAKAIDYYLYHNFMNKSTKYAFSDSLYLDVYGITGKSTAATIVGINSEKEYNTRVPLRTSWDGNEKMFFHYLYNLKEEDVFDSDTSAMVIASSLLRFEIKDIFDNIYALHVRVHLVGDCPPIPVLKVKEIAGHPKERTLSLADSYDKDGVVTKYEFCIDGNIASYKNYDNRFDEFSGVWQSGKAAYGGTYITATTISEVNHAFQETGEHIVYYRCMDNKGAWSTWKKEIINIVE